MNDKITKLKEQRLDLSEKMQACFPEAGPQSPEQRKRYDEMAEEVKNINETLKRLEETEARELELSKTTKPPENRIGESDDEKESRKSEKREAKKIDKEQRAALNYWLRSGNNLGRILTPRAMEVDSEVPKELRHLIEKREMGIGSPTASTPTSVFVPQGFVHDVDIALKAYGQLVANVRDLPTATGQPLPYPTTNDTTQSATYVGEGVQVTEQDISIGNIVFGAWKFTTGLIQVSLELMQDSAFDMETFIREQMAIRLARALEAEIVNGTGSGNSHITGILPSSTAGPTATGSSKNTGGSETGGLSIGSTDLIDLVAAVDPLYRTNAKFVMHDSTWQTLAALLDKYGRPLFLPNPQTGKLESIYGYPIVYSQAMPTIAVNAKTVLFGNLQKYILRRVKELAIVRLVERFADYGQVAFIGFARYDGNLIDAGTHPVKYLVQAAA